MMIISDIALVDHIRYCIGYDDHIRYCIGDDDHIRYCIGGDHISDIALVMIIYRIVDDDHIGYCILVSLFITGNTCWPSQFVRGHSPNSADRYFFCYISEYH